MRARAALLALLALATPVRAAAQLEQGPDAVNRLADEFLQGTLTRNPELATFLGLSGVAHDRLSDNSVDAIAATELVLDRYYVRVLAVDPETVRGRPELVTLGFLREVAISEPRRRLCRTELWAVSEMTGWQATLPQLAAVQPVGSAAARAQALARLGSVPAYIENETARLRHGVRTGYTAPRAQVSRVAQQLDAMLAVPPRESPFFAPAARDTSAAFAQALEALIAERINPAIRAHRDYLVTEYRPRDAVGLAALPGGDACYRAQLRGHTGLDLDPRALHQAGLDQMARVRGEMQAIARRSFNTDDVPGLLARIRGDPELAFRDREQVVAYAGAALDRARREAPRWFGRMPRTELVVEAYDPSEERSAPPAAYDPAVGGGPARFRINAYQPKRVGRVGMEATTFHEAIPGHHLQLGIAQEAPAAHLVTRFLGSLAYTEGWGLYAEHLAEEMRLYSGDADRLGLLSNDAMRAARLVVDPGIHALGWTREQAVEYLVANTGEPRSVAENEVDRYILAPGQATAHMVGMLEIRRLRELAERALGGRFDVRDFHDRVLEDGTVTLPMLREKIQRWVAGGGEVD